MTPRGAQRKGKAGEIELASILSGMFNVEVRRAASPYLPGILAPDVSHIGGMIHCEVKRRDSRLSLSAAIRQAKRDAGRLLAIVAHRGNRQPWLATCELSELPRLAATVNSLLQRGNTFPAMTDGQHKPDTGKE
jgi:hypothetical protein